MSNYATLESVRRLIGYLPNTTVGFALGNGDGSITKFTVTEGYIVDANGSETLTIADVTVYVDGSEVTVSAVDGDTKVITLAAAPGNGLAVTADYSYSEIPDSEILAELAIYTDAIKKRTGTEFSAGNSHTMIRSGDGENDVFFIEKWPLTSLDSYSIDSKPSGLVENTDYWLFPASTRAFWIEFLTPPAHNPADRKNVSITYTYGETNTQVDKWVRLHAARNILRWLMARKGHSGKYKAAGKNRSAVLPTKAYTLYKMIEEDIAKTEQDITGLFDMGIDY